MKVLYSVSLAIVALAAAASNTAFAQDDNLNRVDLDTNELASVGAEADLYEFDTGAMSDDVADEQDVAPFGDMDTNVPTDAAPIAAESERTIPDGDVEVGADADAAAAVTAEERASYLYPEVRQAVIMAVISERQKVGLPSICLSSKLMDGAQAQADDMAKNNMISVTGSDGSDPSARGKAAGFNSTGVAELVGAGFTTAADMVAAWMKAPDSSAIVLGNYTHIGPGYTVEKSQQYVYYWSLDFAAGVGEECSGLAA
uniref:SCP domain-containing protein n=1 Tax=Globisporangium ultimum (strain ATCC 200006 / CBS 805.95 / DAOM BR144) TaxID=431595 RepID=K3WDG5_GLOUD